MGKDVREHLFIQFRASHAIRSSRGRGDLDPLDGGISLKFANHFFAATIRIQDLAEECPECVLLGKDPPTTHGPGLFRFEKRVGNELFKNLADLLEGLLLQQRHFFSKVLLGRTWLSAKGLQVKTWERRRCVFHGLLCHFCPISSATFPCRGVLN